MKLSVIIPCYNVEKYLARCLESIVNQTYRDLEIILVDDGSPDNSGQMCDHWACRDSRIKVVHKKNGGLGFARNSGLEVATGDYVAFVDSDDYVDVSMYEKLLSTARRTGSEIVYCGHKKQQSGGKEITVSDFAEETTFEKEKLPLVAMSFCQPTEISNEMLTMSVWHSVYHRSVIKSEFFSEREVGSEDLAFQIDSVLNSNRVTFIPDALYTYCYNGESLSHTFIAEKFNRYKLLTDKVRDVFSRHQIKSDADYYVFVVAFVSIRQICLSNVAESEKYKYIKKITSNIFWHNANIEPGKLGLLKKMILHCLRSDSPKSLYALSRLYASVVYKLLKKNHN